MSASARETESSPVEYDPVFVHSRREAVLIFGLWVVALLWSVPYCYFNGFPEVFDPDRFHTVWGIPSWLFWGILVPWLVADVFTIWFCFWYMQEDNLGEAHEGADLTEEIIERHRDEPEGQKGGRQ